MKKKKKKKKKAIDLENKVIGRMDLS